MHLLVTNSCPALVVADTGHSDPPHCCRKAFTSYDMPPSWFVQRKPFVGHPWAMMSTCTVISPSKSAFIQHFCLCTAKSEYHLTYASFESGQDSLFQRYCFVGEQTAPYSCPLSTTSVSMIYRSLEGTSCPLCSISCFEEFAVQARA